MGIIGILVAEIRGRISAGDIHKSHTEAQRDQLWHGGERGISPASNFGCVLYYASVPRDQGVDSIFDISLASTIVWPQREARKMGRAITELDTGDHRCEKGEDEILGTLSASITPREEVDDMLIAITPQKHPKQLITMPPPVESGESLLVVSFDGSARTKRKSGSYSAIVW